MDGAARPSQVTCSRARPRSTACSRGAEISSPRSMAGPSLKRASTAVCPTRSEEHTSELQSLRHLVCRLLLEKNTITDNAALVFTYADRLALSNRSDEHT